MRYLRLLPVMILSILLVLGQVEVSAEDQPQWGGNTNQQGGGQSSAPSQNTSPFLGGDNQSEENSKPIPPLAPEGVLAKDYIVDDTRVLSGIEQLYEDLVKKFVLVPEAERRMYVKENFFSSWGVNQKDPESLTEAEVRTFVQQESARLTPGGTVEPYPNQLNARYWRLTPSTMLEGGGSDHRVSVLPLPEDATMPSIFPLSNWTFAVKSSEGTSIQVPVFSETLKGMLRPKKDYAQNPDNYEICVGGCVGNPFTGLKADKKFMEAGIGNRLWEDVVLSCASQGGRLPRAEEAWYFLASRKWAVTSDQLPSVTTLPYYYVLTNDVLDIEHDEGKGLGFIGGDEKNWPAYGLNGIDVLGIKVKKSTAPGEHVIHGFDYHIDFNAFTQLGQNPMAHGGNPRAEYNKSVAYCVYD